MSIEALCQGDKVSVQVATTTKGSMGGASRSYTDVAGAAALDCLIQNMRQSESRGFAGRGSRYGYNVFFSSDVGLTTNHRLKQTVSGNVALSVPIYLRVLDYYSEGRPGEQLLWIADCEQDTMRPES